MAVYTKEQKALNVSRYGTAFPSKQQVAEYEATKSPIEKTEYPSGVGVVIASTVSDAGDTEDAPNEAVDVPVAGPDTVFEWRIPLEGWRYLTVTSEAPDVDAARVDAMERYDLTQQEAFYVLKSDPAIVRDRVGITLDHAQALAHVDERDAVSDENNRIRDYYISQGVDPNDIASRDRKVDAVADKRVRDAEAVIAAKEAAIGSAVLDTIKALTAVGEQTGVIEKPVAPVPFDYTGVTMVVPVGKSAKDYPELRNAAITDADPASEMTESERRGFALMRKDIDYRIRQQASVREADDIRAANSRLTALLGA